MRISRAIGIQTVTISFMFLLLVAAVSFYWLRLDSGQARIRDDAITLRDYRLLSEVVGGWVVSGDLIFGRDQFDMIEAGLRQGEQIISLVDELSRESLSLAYPESFAQIRSLVEENQRLLLQLRDSVNSQYLNLYPVWDATSQEVISLVVNLGEDLIVSSEENSQLAAQERSNFIGLFALGCIIFSLLIIGLWRWVTRLIVRPLRQLTEGARTALELGTQMGNVGTRVDEIESLSISINNFTQSLSDRVEQRTRQLKQQQLTLEKEVELRKAAQQAAQEEAQKAIAASKAKSQFLANMSHELRTPLNAILGGAQLLGIMDLKADASEWAQRIESSGNHLLALLNTVLDFSQLDEEGFDLSHEEFKTESLLQHCESVFEVNSEGKNLELELSVDSELPEKLTGDSLRIQQILAHLIGNAVKFTEAGNVRIRVESVRTGDRRVRLDWEIADTGIGIREENLERIFEFFEQEDNSDSRAYGGSGLGLAISRELARMMGGDIAVQSTPGEGSVFHCSMLLDQCGITESVDSGSAERRELALS